MAGCESQISGFGNDHSTNCATVTSLDSSYWWRLLLLPSPKIGKDQCDQIKIAKCL